MARGWESKSVEAQIESAEPRKISPHSAQITSAELETIRKRESILLSRTRVCHELETAQNPRYRQVLDKALTDLNRQLAQLDQVAHAVAGS